VQALESIRDFSRHKNSLGLHFGHRWFMHFGYANGFLGLCHTFFGWSSILGHGTYQWFSFPGRCLGCFGHFVFMCSSSTFLFHTGSTCFFFLPLSFSKFWQESYASMWGHYGSKIVGVFPRPLNKMLSSTINILWWYRPFFYGGLCPIYVSRELGSSGSTFVLQVLYFR